MSRFKRATVTYLGPSSALRHHCNPSGSDYIFDRDVPQKVSEADAKHYAKHPGGFSVNIEYFPKKATPAKEKKSKRTGGK